MSLVRLLLCFFVISRPHTCAPASVSLCLTRISWRARSALSLSSLSRTVCFLSVTSAAWCVWAVS